MLNRNLLNSGQMMRFHSKDIIFKEGESEKNKIYYIVNGNIVLAKKISCKKYYRTSFNENDIFGLFEPVIKQPRQTNAIALTEAVLYSWTLENFYLAVSMHPEIAILAINNLCSLLRNINLQKEELPKEMSEEKILKIDSKNINDVELETVLSKIAFYDTKDNLNDAYKNIGTEFKNGDIIFTQGENTNDIYIILEGNAVIEIKNELGARFRLTELKENDFLGEMAFFDGQPRSATAIAKGNLKLLKFTKDTFGVLFQLHPKWTIKLILTLSARIFNTYKLVFKEGS